MSTQLRLDLPVRTALGRRDFFVSDANALAVAQVDRWRDWPSRKMILTGPPKSGKTHLCHVWKNEAQAEIVPADALPHLPIPALAQTSACVEDVDQIAGNRDAEEALFHLHNMVLSEGHSLLLSAQKPPMHWDLSIPDLKSRMMGTDVAQLEKPDDQLLAAVLNKLFTDRQIVPMPDVIPYLVRYMDRSFDAADRIVELLDSAALGTPRGVTRALASKVLKGLEINEEQP